MTWGPWIDNPITRIVKPHIQRTWFVEMRRDDNETGFNRLPDVYENLRLQLWDTGRDTFRVVQASRDINGNLVQSSGQDSARGHACLDIMTRFDGAASSPTNPPYTFGRRSQDLCVYNVADTLALAAQQPYENTNYTQYESATNPGQPTDVPVYDVWIGWEFAGYNVQSCTPRGFNTDDAMDRFTGDGFHRIEGGGSARIGALDGSLAESLCVPGAPWFWPADGFGSTVATAPVSEEFYYNEWPEWTPDAAALAALDGQETVGAITQYDIPPFFEIPNPPAPPVFDPAFPFGGYYMFPSGVNTRRYEAMFPPIGWAYQGYATFRGPRYRYWEGGLRTIGRHFESVGGPQISLNNQADTAWHPIEDS